MYSREGVISYCDALPNCSKKEKWIASTPRRSANLIKEMDSL